MEGIGRALGRIAESEPNLTVVVPMHMNPAVRASLLPPLKGRSNVIVTEPLAYGEFCRLMNRATIVLTDSGGLQEEAPSLGKPVLVMRDTTERGEAIACGTARLVGTDEEHIVESVRSLLRDGPDYRKMADGVSPYGEGHAARRAVEALEHFFACVRPLGWQWATGLPIGATLDLDRIMPDVVPAEGGDPFPMRQGA
jgi:UDP-N-acetylglucosamine 2-epimerase (non-hydrolysing)